MRPERAGISGSAGHICFPQAWGIGEEVRRLPPALFSPGLGAVAGETRMSSERKARDIWLEVTLRFPQRGNLARFTPCSPLRGTLPARRSYGLLTIHPDPREKQM